MIPPFFLKNEKQLNFTIMKNNNSTSEKNGARRPNDFQRVLISVYIMDLYSTTSPFSAFRYRFQIVKTSELPGLR